MPARLDLLELMLGLDFYMDITVVLLVELLLTPVVWPTKLPVAVVPPARDFSIESCLL